MNGTTELDELIKLISCIRKTVQENWNEKNIVPEKYNYRRKMIDDIFFDTNLMGSIIHYQQFLNEATIELTGLFGNMESYAKPVGKINTRVKTTNSIFQKIQNYQKGDLKGKVAINKCLNDLFGIRVIFSNNPNIEKLIEHTKKTFPSLKCIDASKSVGYTAAHIYFSNNNYEFPWELQIWRAADETNNIELHKIYKQDYTKWETEAKGGEV